MAMITLDVSQAGKGWFRKEELKIIGVKPDLNY